MRLVVYPHDLSIGGSQINAIDLAAAAAAAGHEVIVYGQPGPLVDYIRELDLEFVPAATMQYRPAPTRIAQLAALAARRKIDLVHAYEWPPCLDAFYGAHLLLRVPLLCTVLSMEVSPLVPNSVPLIMGTKELADRAGRGRAAPVWTLEPPIRSDRDTPEIDGTEFRRKYVSDGEILIVTVSRLATDLKLDALVRAMDAASELAERYPIRLVLVGDGPARAALEKRAACINDRHRRKVIFLHGAESDPRKCYTAADIVLGMGSSALRAMSMQRPVIVQGEEAFSLTFEPATYDKFLSQGFYGIGDPQNDADHLVRQLEALIQSSSLRDQLGRFGRECVSRRFSLERAARLHFGIYEHVVAGGVSIHPLEAVRALSLAAKVEFDNHRPSIKKTRELRVRTMLDAAAGGSWPPMAV